MRAALLRWARPAGASSAVRPRRFCSAPSPAAETPRGKSRAALVLQPGDELSGFVVQVCPCLVVPHPEGSVGRCALWPCCD